MGKEFSIPDQAAGINWPEVEATRTELARILDSFVGYNAPELAHHIPHSTDSLEAAPDNSATEHREKLREEIGQILGDVGRPHSGFSFH